jgi:predicted DNA-binding transcriptional regulator AlpA
MPADTPTPTAEQPPVITKRRVAAMIDVTTRTIDRWVSLGTFPSPLRLGNGVRPRVRWRRSDVEAFLSSRMVGA